MNRKKFLAGLGMLCLALGWAGPVALVAAEEPSTKPAVANPAVAAPAQKVEAPAPLANTVAAPAAAAETLTVEEGVICTGIENRTPQAVAESFALGVERLSCYTKLSGGKAGDEIVHHWKKGDQSIAKVTLKIGGSPWRTYSTKLMPEDAAGKWSVDILQGETVLKTIAFEIQPAAAK